MPFPIQPISDLTAHKDLFECRSTDGLSELQAYFLGVPDAQPAVRSAKVKMLPPNTINMLKQIFSNENEVLTAATSIAKRLPTANRIYSVPTSVNDNELLMLKTSGLIEGHYRSVTITEDGFAALRKSALNEENKLVGSRTSDMFDVRSAADSNDKFVRTASKKKASDKFVKNH